MQTIRLRATITQSQQRDVYHRKNAERRERCAFGRPRERNEQCQRDNRSYEQVVANKGVAVRGFTFENFRGRSLSRAMPWTIRSAIVICARIVLSVATMTMALIVAGLTPAITQNTRLNGAGESERRSIDTEFTGTAATKT
jgi:hypothetical protein